MTGWTHPDGSGRSGEILSAMSWRERLGMWLVSNSPTVILPGVVAAGGLTVVGGGGGSRCCWVLTSPPDRWSAAVALAVARANGLWHVAAWTEQRRGVDWWCRGTCPLRGKFNPCRGGGRDVAGWRVRAPIVKRAKIRHHDHLRRGTWRPPAGMFFAALAQPGAVFGTTDQPDVVLRCWWLLNGHRRRRLGLEPQGGGLRHHPDRGYYAGPGGAQNPNSKMAGRPN